MNKSIALIDRDGDFVCRMDPEQAAELVRRGAAAVEGAGKRARLRLKTSHRVSDFRSVFDRRRAERYTYEENYDGRVLVVLKRYDEKTKSFKRWDGDLTFDELHAGRMRHKEARADVVVRETEPERMAA